MVAPRAKEKVDFYRNKKQAFSRRIFILKCLSFNRFFREVINMATFLMSHAETIGFYLGLSIGMLAFAYILFLDAKLIINLIQMGICYLKEKQH